MLERLEERLRSRAKRFLRDIPEGAIPPTPAGVLVPIIDRPADPHLLFTRRTDTVRSHKGQISFPGGAREPGDATLLHTALREADEELGIDPAAVRVVGELDDYVTVTNYLITPYVGLIPDGLSYRPHEDEVAEVLEVPWSELRDPKRHRIERILWQGEEKPVHYFDCEKCVVWGVTARILVQLLELFD